MPRPQNSRDGRGPALSMIKAQYLFDQKSVLTNNRLFFYGKRLSETKVA